MLQNYQNSKNIFTNFEIDIPRDGYLFKKAAQQQMLIFCFILAYATVRIKLNTSKQKASAQQRNESNINKRADVFWLI